MFFRVFKIVYHIGKFLRQNQGLMNAFKDFLQYYTPSFDEYRNTSYRAFSQSPCSMLYYMSLVSCCQQLPTHSLIIISRSQTSLQSTHLLYFNYIPCGNCYILSGSIKHCVYRVIYLHHSNLNTYQICLHKAGVYF